MAKTLSILTTIVLVILQGASCIAQQETNCNAVCVLTDVGATSVDVSQLATVTGPRLAFPNCDTVRKDAFLKRYTLYCLRGSEMIWIKLFYGRNAPFDKQTLSVIRSLNAGDTIFLKNMAAGTNNVDEFLPPVKLHVTNEKHWEDKVKKSETTSTVTRTIVISDSAYSPKKKEQTSPTDTLLANLLIDKVKTGALKAYAKPNFDGTTPMSQAEIREVFAVLLDSVIIEDVDGSLVTRVPRHTFDYAGALSFKVLEEWTPDAEAEDEKVQILAIAPVCDYYDDDGNAWAHRPLFWIKYEDVADIIENYDADYPKNNFEKAVMKDYKKTNKTRQ